MSEFDTNALSALCESSKVTADHMAILQGLQALLPALTFRYVIGRGGWHRIGGIVDIEHRRIADHLREWVENEHDGDLDEILNACATRPMFATRMQGTTHYFVAATGDNAQHFVQLEIETLREMIWRPLWDPEWLPEDIEEFIDPLDFPELEPETIAAPVYQFRRITAIPDLVSEDGELDRGSRNIRRFLDEWDRSSAAGAGPFSEFWVLSMREYINSDRERQFMVRPVRIDNQQLSALPSRADLRGSGLAKALHDFDRRMGYPFAWYFFMLTAKHAPLELAEAVLRDQMGAYDYLPAKDLKLLREWEQRPYGV